MTILRRMRTRRRPTAQCAGVLAVFMIASMGTSALAADPSAGAPATPSVIPTTDSSSGTTRVVEPAAAADATPEPRYRFTGHGTDHGVGLSQRGAAGRAAAGQDYVTILKHYFNGVDMGTVPADTTIRALLVRNYAATGTQTALIKGYTIRNGADGHGMRWSVDTPDPAVQGQTFPGTWSLVLKGTGASGHWHLQVQDSAGKVRAAFIDTNARVEVTPVPPATQDDPLGVIEVLIRPDAKYDKFAGSIRIGRVDGRIRVVDVVPIEPFVRSVTPKELGPANKAEALKSQAVVARSYFLAGRNASTSWLAFDVESDRASESYRGIKGENATVTQSVDATAYQVVTYHGAIARTFYHAVGGGATEASRNVFTGEDGKPGAITPYLRGSLDLCPDPRDPLYPEGPQDVVPCDASASAYSWGTRAFTLSQLSDILKHDSRTNVGTLTRWPIESESTYLAKRASSVAADTRDAPPSPTNRGISGRLTWVVLTGTRHGKTVTKRVAGWLFKSVFNKYRGTGDPLDSTMIFRASAN